MLSLSSQFAAATTDAARLQLLAAGQVMLETYKGTSFDVYYVLNGIMLLILAVVMLRTPVFNKVTASFALASGILMSIPSSAGAIGMVFALASLIPWAVFSVLAALRLLQLSGTARDQ
jgi:cellulose synthase/poly-beta-1,6-N-acetylglucosamine synthase-like glycosyltransferase